jgi:hypothetical protein
MEHRNASAWLRTAVVFCNTANVVNAVGVEQQLLCPVAGVLTAVAGRDGPVVAAIMQVLHLDGTVLLLACLAVHSATLCAVLRCSVCRANALLVAERELLCEQLQGESCC